MRLLPSKDPKLVRTQDGTYVQLGRGVRVLAGRPGRPVDEEILEAYGLTEGRPKALERTDDPHHGGPSVWPRHKGGGFYELSDGSTVRGQDDATAAQAELDEE